MVKTRKLLKNVSKYKYECPEFIEAGLTYLAREIERVEWNITQKKYEAPVANNGGFYKTEVFTIRAYNWKENPDRLPNFRCGSFCVYWYKYLGRGMSMNKAIDANEFFQLIDKCFESVRKKERRLK